MPTLKAISVRQPWANAIMLGKDVENRSRYFIHRGSLLIHASLKLDAGALTDRRILSLPINDLVFGHLIGVVTVLDCVRNSNVDGRILVANGNCCSQTLVRFCDPYPTAVSSLCLRLIMNFCVVCCRQASKTNCRLTCFLYAESSSCACFGGIISPIYSKPAVMRFIACFIRLSLSRTPSWIERVTRQSGLRSLVEIMLGWLVALKTLFPSPRHMLAQHSLRAFPIPTP
jgi:hypothetical protein